MLNIFRRHVASCKNSGTRTGQKCPNKPACPIHVEGLSGAGKRIKPQSLIDPRTGNGIRDWARAVEVLRDLEAPSPVLVAELRTPIKDAIEHFSNTKAQTSIDRRRKVKNVLKAFREFLEAGPRAYRFMQELKFHDITDHMSTWQGASSTRRANRELLKEFFNYCEQADYTTKNLGRKLPTIEDTTEQAEPFRSSLTEPGIKPQDDEIEKVMKALVEFPDEYGRKGQPIAIQTEAFVLVMRYTGLDVL